MKGAVMVRAWKGAAEAYQVERDYYNHRADAMIAEAQIKINKERKHGNAE